MQRKSAWVFILIGMIMGSILGLSLPHPIPSESESWVRIVPLLVEWIAIPGNVFLGLLQMVMIPLVVSSVALGIANQGGNRDLGKLATLSIGYFLATTAIAIVIGIFLSYAIQPGKYVDSTFVQSKVDFHPVNIPSTDPSLGVTASADANRTKSDIREDSIPKILMEIFPKNPVKAIVDGNMLTIVIFSVFLGLALSKMGEIQAEPLVRLLDSLQEYSMVVVGWALAIAPIAVFCLMTQALYNIGFELLAGLSMYVITVLLGLGLVLVVFAVLGLVLGGIPPLVFIARLKELQILAFSSSSSAAVLPISLKTSIEGLRVKPRIADFVIPLGATINMNGTAIYQGIATLFLAEIFGIDLNFSQLVLLVVTVVGASIGTAATPGVGIVILSGILSSFGIPLEGIAILFGVDRFLDMCRTAVNVTGDVVASKIIDRLLSK